MTLPTTTTSIYDDSDIFGPSRSLPMRNTRPKVPMISAKLRLREERKKILQLCAHKLERIKDSETNLRRSVCINNTYSRLTDELRREKQNKFLANLPKSESTNNSQLNGNNQINNNSPVNPNTTKRNYFLSHTPNHNNNNLDTDSNKDKTNSNNNNNNNVNINNNNNISNKNHNSNYQKYNSSRTNHNVDTDLEILDREINALDASIPLPLVDPEITQGAEQLERIISRKRTRRDEEDNDRLVREALQQFYLPSSKLLSEIEECPVLPSDKRQKQTHTDLDLDLTLDLNQNQKEFEVIMDALRLGASAAVNGGGCNSCTSNVNIDTCGQAAMLSESGVFHNLVVTSLET